MLPRRVGVAVERHLFFHCPRRRLPSGCFKGSNLISERFPMGWPGVARIGKTNLTRMRREPHAALVRPNQDRSVLSPEVFREPDCERPDAHRSRPFLLVCLVERRIEQPFVFDGHRGGLPPTVWRTPLAAANGRRTLREKFRDPAFRFRDFCSAMFRFCGNGYRVTAIGIPDFIGVFAALTAGMTFSAISSMDLRPSTGSAQSLPQ